MDCNACNKNVCNKLSEIKSEYINNSSNSDNSDKPKDTNSDNKDNHSASFLRRKPPCQ